MGPETVKLLWVDDSGPLLSLYKAGFESLGFQVTATSSPPEALALLSQKTADLVVLDYEMPEMDGGLLASRIKSSHPRLPVILHTGCDHIPEDACQFVDAICYKTAPRENLVATIEAFSTREQRQLRAL